jgi:glycosyltransferase involved in cell wall biosynthesis
VPFGDVDTLAARAVELLEDRERARAMGRCGRQVVLENYVPDRVVPQYEEVYQKALEAAGVVGST